MQHISHTSLLILHTQMCMLQSSQVSLFEWRSHPSEDSIVDDSLDTCGTVACAIGHATAIPAFNMQGFTYDLRQGEPSLKIDDHIVHNWEAVALFFDLTQIEAVCMFGEDDPRPTYNFHLSGVDTNEIKRVAKQILGKEGAERKLDDRTKVLRRIRRYLRSNGHITKEQAKVLKKAEKPAGKQ